jgi:hypothetical protein
MVPSMSTSTDAQDTESTGPIWGGIAKRFCWGLTCFIFVAMALATLSNDLQLLRNGNTGTLYPSTVYEVWPIPGTAADSQSPGATGADFSQVYTSALALRHGESAYNPTTPEYRDYFGRPSGYPPLTNWVYVPLSWLPYHKALAAHSLLSLAGFLAAVAWLLRKTGLSRHIGRVALATASFYFLTPIGVSHLERGQFDWLVATAIVLCVSCWFLPGNRFGTAVLCGVVGALKWTAAPFLGCFAALGFLVASGLKRWVFFAIPVVMALGTFLFWSELKEYWGTIRYYELDSEPMGLTLEAYLPRLWAKAMPVILTACLATVVLVRSRSAAARARILGASSLPFALALTNLTVAYVAESFEYHTVTMLAMVPVLVVWAEREPWVSRRLKAFVAVVFALFLLIAFRVFGPGNLVDVFIINALYAGCALLFFGVSIYIAVAVPVPRSSPNESSPERPALMVEPG